MSFITLFSAPKPFDDPHIATLQRNAVGSWRHLQDAQVILLGAENGMARAARELEVRHIPDVECSPNGTPLVSSMIEQARQNSDSPLLCIINTDIIVLPEFEAAARETFQRLREFVLLGRRWDLDITQAIDFSNGWSDRLRDRVRADGLLHRPSGSDYFIFPRSCFNEVPPFAIGRAGWDNWMIYQARQRRWPVIDGTASVMVVHQNHDYRHLPGAKPHYDHPESEINTRLAGGQAAIRYSILDATARLVDHQLVAPTLTRGRLLRGVELLLRRVFFFLPERRIEDLVRPKRWKRRLQKLFK